jgi:lipoprotein-anchoring transpeptidase ErfK/SrfK
MSASKPFVHVCGIGIFFVSILSTPVLAQSLSFAPADRFGSPFGLVQPEAQPPAYDNQTGDDLPAALRRQVVSYPTNEAPGTIVIDTAHTSLYLTLGDGKAMRYGIGVGRDGFTWSGVERISRKAEWPDWIPPAEMVARQPYLPRWVGGGPGNPLGARALYLGNSQYRIHGTNDPTSIGKRVSSGCIRLRNEDVVDLYSRVGVGTKVIVLSGSNGRMTMTIPLRPAAGPAPVRAVTVAVRQENISSNDATRRRPDSVLPRTARDTSIAAFGLY